MKRWSLREWMRIFPWPVWPLAGQARVGQNMGVGSMTVLLSWRCWGACQAGVCLDPHFYDKRASPRFSGELPQGPRRHENAIFKVVSLLPHGVVRRCHQGVIG